MDYYVQIPLTTDIKGQNMVRLQMANGRYWTKHDQAIRAEFIEEFTHIEHFQEGKTNSSMNSVRVA